MSRLIPDQIPYSQLNEGGGRYLWVPYNTTQENNFLQMAHGCFTTGDRLNKNDYPELFSVIGYDYGGSGDYFNLPDTRDYFIRSAGIKNGIGQKSEDTLK